ATAPQADDTAVAAQLLKPENHPVVIGKAVSVTGAKAHTTDADRRGGGKRQIVHLGSPAGTSAGMRDAIRLLPEDAAAPGDPQAAGTATPCSPCRCGCHVAVVSLHGRGMK